MHLLLGLNRKSLIHQGRNGHHPTGAQFFSCNNDSTLTTSGQQETATIPKDPSRGGAGLVPGHQHEPVSGCLVQDDIKQVLGQTYAPLSCLAAGVAHVLMSCSTSGDLAFFNACSWSSLQSQLTSNKIWARTLLNCPALQPDLRTSECHLLFW